MVLPDDVTVGESSSKTIDEALEEGYLDRNWGGPHKHTGAICRFLQ